MAKIVCLGDAMIAGRQFEEAAKTLGNFEVVASDWETNWDQLQHRRLKIEQEGPGIEPVPEFYSQHQNADIAFGLFGPFSDKVMDSFEHLRLIGVARAGTENVDIAAATERGILVVNVMGRNAEAVSDFAIGMMLSESRNIARAHAAIHTGKWRKTFPNSNFIPEMKGKRIGIVGFGHIGRLIAEKLSGFKVDIAVYDPWIDEAVLTRYGATSVDKETLFKTSDYVTLHARLTKESTGLVGETELSLMKPTAYLVNTARAGLIDMDALMVALKNRQIAGAALDVFEEEPIPADHPILTLDNLTLTTHIAGTTTEALTRSPKLLVEQVRETLLGNGTSSVKNPSVLARAEVQAWLKHTLQEVATT